MYNAITNPSKINARSPEHNAYGAYISHQFAHFSCCSFWISREMSNKRPGHLFDCKSPNGDYTKQQ